jgi:hypothetical protein
MLLTMRKVVALAILLLAKAAAFGQIKNLAFREFDIDNNQNYNLSLGKTGLIIFGETEPGLWSFRMIDTNLNDVQQWSLRLTKYAQVKDYVYIEKTGTAVIWILQRVNQYALITIHPDKSGIQYKQIVIPRKTFLKGAVAVVNSDLWLPAASKKTEFMYRLQPESGKMDLINIQSAVYKERAQILGIQDFGNGEVAVSYIHGYNKRRVLEVSIYNDSGNIIKPSLLGSLSVAQRQVMRDAKVSRLDSNDYSITGMFSKSRSSVINKGVFFARYSGDKVRYLSFFNYEDFAHFNDYKSKSIWQNIYNIEDRFYNNFALFNRWSNAKMAIQHKAVVTESGLIFIAEYYYPTYRQEISAVGMVAGSRNATRTVFDGYQYTHAMAVGISPSGEKQFDACIPLFTTFKPYIPVTFLRVNKEGENLKMVQTSGRRVYSAVIRNQEIKYYDWTVTHNLPENQRESWTLSNAVWWYDNKYFILEKQRTREKGVFLGKGQTRCYGSVIGVD